MTRPTPFWGIARRAFGSEVASYSALALALFSFHIGYSAVTSSEVPTIFFLACGVYFWTRLKSENEWRWLVPGGLALIAASLCRFEAWIYILALILLLPDLSLRRPTGGLKIGTLARTAIWGFLASAGAIGWMVLSLVKWGDVFASPHATFGINSATSVNSAAGIYNLLVVPGALLLTLSPVIAGFASWGIFNNLAKGKPLPRALALLVLASLTADYYACVAKQVTMARYTLMYSWLAIPFAFEGLRLVSEKVARARASTLHALALSFFVVWQAGIVAGAYWTTEPQIADRLSVISPTLPLPVELRTLTQWLRRHAPAGDSVVVDQFQYEAQDIIRFSGLSFSRCLAVPLLADRSQIATQVRDFVRTKHPKLLIYCTKGGLGKLCPLRGRENAACPALDVRLHRLWKGRTYYVYQVELEGPALKD